MSTSPSPLPVVLQSGILEGVNLHPQNVFEALDCLETVSARFRALGDARAVFPEVYGVITRRVRDAIQDEVSPVFLEPAWISRLAGRFCEKYLEQLAAALQGRPVGSAAWALAEHCATLNLTLPVQDALLGINAHINYDLAQGLYDNVLGSGAAGDARMISRYRHDHDAVNGILAAAMPEILDILVKRYHCRATRIFTFSRTVQDLLCRMMLRVLRAWRDDVWNNLLTMLDAPDPLAYRRVLAKMDRSSHLLGQLACSLNVTVAAGSMFISDLRGIRRPSRPVYQSGPFAASPSPALA